MILAGPADLAASAFTLAEALSHWFSLHQRDLPWRLDRSPYRVWLSEIMLQQTQVATVVPYFERFCARFPTVDDLAAADLDEVLSLWSGLGYYRRGRNLHRAAQDVAERGAFPDTAAGLRELPGVGAYTAGAIATFAFGRREPLVDGNVQRVLSRLLGDATPVDTPAGQRAAWSAAEALVSAAADPSDLNEGLMELGALVCTPRAPRCEVCPWTDVCVAHARGVAEELPVKLKRPKRKTVRVASVVLRWGDAVWLERNDDDGLFGGLWAPPTLELDEATVVSRAFGALLRDRGAAPPATWPAPVVVQRTLTHRDLTLEAVRLRLGAELPDVAEIVAPTETTGRWVSAAGLDALGTSAAVRALLAATA